MIRNNKNDVRKVESTVTASPSPTVNSEPSPIPSATPSTQSYSSPITASTLEDSDSPTAIIGPKIRVKGELIGEEDLLIQGYVEGTIDLKGNNLKVGKQGIIKANVLAKTISIEGTVEGDIFGQERIAILSSKQCKRKPCCRPSDFRRRREIPRLYRYGNGNTKRSIERVWI